MGAREPESIAMQWRDSVSVWAINGQNDDRVSQSWSQKIMGNESKAAATRRYSDSGGGVTSLPLPRCLKPLNKTLGHEKLWMHWDKRNEMRPQERERERRDQFSRLMLCCRGSSKMPGYKIAEGLKIWWDGYKLRLRRQSFAPYEQFIRRPPREKKSNKYHPGTEKCLCIPPV